MRLIVEFQSLWVARRQYHGATFSGREWLALPTAGILSATP